MSLVYGSVCSGIEAASAAWEPLGWRPAFFAEIEKFPSAVLAHRFGSNMPGDPAAQNGVPNHGDFTKIGVEGGPAAGPVDLLVGGTPCQSFSVAGKRLGLDDPRGNLALEFLALARRLRARWIVWENVPGVLSSRSDDGSSDFATFLSFVRECGYGFAWRVLDAQYVRVQSFPCAVPQRRRRVFLVGHLGDWRRAAAVLFDGEGMRGDPAPRRQAGQGTGPTLASRSTGGGGLGTDAEIDGGLIANSGDAAFCVSVNGQRSNDAETETRIAHALRGEGFDASEDGTGRGMPLVPVKVAGTMKAGNGGGGWSNSVDHAAGGYMIPVLSSVAFSSKDFGADASDETSPTLRAGGFDASHANAGVPTAVAFDLRGRDGGAVPQEASSGEAASGNKEHPHETANIRAASGGSSRSYVALPHGQPRSHVERSKAQDCGQTGFAVRRLTPVECERLQGFPDGWTDIPWRGRESAPDGPRYKALGNSMAVNVMRLIGERIDTLERLVAEGRIA